MPAPPTVEPDASPTTCVEINQEWASWLQGRVWNMEFQDWQEPWGDAAIDRSSRLADLIAAGNCSGGNGLSAERKLIVDTTTRFMNSTTIVAVSPLDNLTVTVAGANERWLMNWRALLRVTGSPYELDMYLYVDGVNASSPYPCFTYYRGVGREHVNWSFITLPLSAGVKTFEVRYRKTSGTGKLESIITGQQQVRAVQAWRVE